jgi:hypothetical protein
VYTLYSSQVLHFLFPSALRGVRGEGKRYRIINFRIISNYMFLILDHLPDVMGRADLSGKIVTAVSDFHSMAFCTLCECWPQLC